MPILKHMREKIDAKIAKFGEEAHCNELFVSEELRKEAVKNLAGKTRISLETYSVDSYKQWNAMLEGLMQECGCNPLLVVDLLHALVYEARRNVAWSDPKKKLPDLNGIQVLIRGLSANIDYEADLRKAKSEKLARRKKAA